VPRTKLGSINVEPGALDKGHIARGRKQRHHHCQEINEDDRLPIGGDRDADDRAGGKCHVQTRVALERGDESNRDADGEGPQRGAEKQLERDRQAPQKHVEHILPGAERSAPITSQEAPEPENELHEDRPVEPEIVANPLHDGGVVHVDAAGHRRHDRVAR
jgi:hypothetical protein